MSDIIQLLPDSLANQIAAGEVIQRPASVIKELIENSVDSGASKIDIFIKEAGRALIQVIDNGSGMSETDARMSFERHATSKIKNIDDLFKIKTMGFRGEALASIAAIAQVEMKSRKENSELGTHIEISDSKVEKQEYCSCQKGTQISVKNLFYNVPARRKFLKSNQTELRHIITEFQRVALCNPEIEMTLNHNNSEIYNLPSGNIKQRIVNIFGKSINNALISIKTDTILANIHGFIGKPEFSKKSTSEQYFFVNNRYMRHHFFYKTLMSCYEKLIQAENYPSFFIFIDIDPSKIDINIHPTKTEIKFEDEKAISQILSASIREALGKFNIVPSIDFTLSEQIEIPIFKGNSNVQFPKIDINQNYNPFKQSYSEKKDRNNLQNWEKLYDGFEKKESENIEQKFDFDDTEQDNIEPEIANVFQFKNRYIFCQVKSGLMIIDQKKAYERIIFEKLIGSVEGNFPASQQTMFPEIIEFTAEDTMIINELSENFKKLGFDINSFGKNTFIINGTPGYLEINQWKDIIVESIEHYKIFEEEKSIIEKLSISIAKSSSKNFNNKLSPKEMNNIINSLFQCSVQNYTPDGKLIISMLTESEIEKIFKV